MRVNCMYFCCCFSSASADFTIASNDAAKEHCLLRIGAMGLVFIEPLASDNGGKSVWPTVDNQPITHSLLLQPNSILCIGGKMLRFDSPSPMMKMNECNSMLLKSIIIMLKTAGVKLVQFQSC